MPERMIEEGKYALCTVCGFHTGNVMKNAYCLYCGSEMIACDIVIRWDKKVK